VNGATEPRGVDAPDVPPPLLSRWRNLYVLLLVELGVLVALFYGLTRWASGSM